MLPKVHSAVVRAGWVAANSMLRFPPSEAPNTTARSEPAASSTARRSSIRCSSDGSAFVGTGSDMPVPRLSNRISRENAASRWKPAERSGSSQASSTCETQPGT